MDVQTLLTQTGRDWTARPPAREQAIERLRQNAPGPLPDEYVDLLRYTNGGEGPLNLPPLFFMLYEAEYTDELNQSADQRELYPGYFVFGSNGGMESIAFDTRGREPWPIVMYDPVAGFDSAVTIAKNMKEFIAAIGIDAEE